MDKHLAYAPPVLIVELFRLKDGQSVQERTPVTVQCTIAFPLSSGGATYDLRGLISGNNSHWWSYVRLGADNWFLVDDARVKALREGLPDHDVSRTAALLWLEKRM